MNLPLSLGGYLPALAGEYAQPVGRGYKSRITLPANWTPNVQVVGGWTVPTFASDDGKLHTLFEVRKDANNWVRVSKLADGSVEFRTCAAGTEKSATCTGESWDSGDIVYITFRYGGGNGIGRVNNDSTATITSPGTFASGTWLAYIGANWAQYNAWDGWFQFLAQNEGTQNGDDARYASGAGQHIETWMDTYRANVVLYVSSPDGSVTRASSYQGGTNVLGATSSIGRYNYVAASSQYISYGNASAFDAKTKMWVLVEVERDLSGVLEIIAGRWGSANNVKQWHLYLNTGNRIGFEVGDGAGNSWFGVTPTDTVTAGTRLMILARLDLTQGTDAARLKIDISVYNGSTRKYGSWSSQTISFTGSAPGALITAGASESLYTGRDGTGSYFDGKIDHFEWAVAQTITDAQRDQMYPNEIAVQYYRPDHAYTFDNNANDWAGAASAINGTVTGATQVDDLRHDPGRMEMFDHVGQYLFDGVDDNVNLGNVTKLDGTNGFSMFGAFTTFSTMPATGTLCSRYSSAAANLRQFRVEVNSNGVLTVVLSTDLLGGIVSCDTPAATIAASGTYEIWIRYDGTQSTNAAKLRLAVAAFNRASGTWGAFAEQTLNFIGTVPTTLTTPAGAVAMQFGNRADGSNPFNGLIDEWRLHKTTAVSTVTLNAETVYVWNSSVWTSRWGFQTDASDTLGDITSGSVNGPILWPDGRRPSNLDLAADPGDSSNYEIDRATNSGKGRWGIRVLRPSAGGSFVVLKNFTIATGSLMWLGAMIAESAKTFNTSNVRVFSASLSPTLDPSGTSYTRYVDVAYLQQVSGTGDLRSTNMGSGDEIYIDDFDAVQFATVAFDVLAQVGTGTVGFPLVGFRNFAENSGIYTPAFRNVGSWESSLPLTNLKDPLISVYAQTTDLLTASTKFEIDLGVARNLRLLGLFGHNLSLDGLVRVRASNVAGSYTFANTVYDSDWVEAYPPIYPDGLLPSSHESYATRKLTEEEWSEVALRFPFYHIIPGADVSARYLQFEFDDQGNDWGALYFGYLWISSAWEPSMSWALGRTVQVEDASQVSETGGGARFYDRRPMRRVWRFDVNVLPENEATAYALKMARSRGLTRPVFVALDPYREEGMHEYTIMGDLRELPALGWTPLMTERASQSFTVSERV